MRWGLLYEINIPGLWAPQRLRMGAQYAHRNRVYPLRQSPFVYSTEFNDARYWKAPQNVATVGMMP